MELKVTIGDSYPDGEHDHLGTTLADLPLPQEESTRLNKSSMGNTEAMHQSNLQLHMPQALFTSPSDAQPPLLDCSVFNSIWSEQTITGQPNFGPGWSDAVDLTPAFDRTQDLSPVRPFEWATNDSGKMGGLSDDGTPRNILVEGEKVVTPRRPIGACNYCKRLKMKCTFKEGSDICDRCKTANKACLMGCQRRGRMLTRRERIMREIAIKEQVIDELLGLIRDMSGPIQWPPNIPEPKGLADSERLPDQEILTWVESIRYSKPPTLTNSIDGATSNQEDIACEISRSLSASSNVKHEGGKSNLGEGDSK